MSLCNVLSMRMGVRFVHCLIPSIVLRAVPGILDLQYIFIIIIQYSVSKFYLARQYSLVINLQGWAHLDLRSAA